MILGDRRPLLYFIPHTVNKRSCPLSTLNNLSNHSDYYLSHIQSTIGGLQSHDRNIILLAGNSGPGSFKYSGVSIIC